MAHIVMVKKGNLVISADGVDGKHVHYKDTESGQEWDQKEEGFIHISGFLEWVDPTATIVVDLGQKQTREFAGDSDPLEFLQFAVKRSRRDPKKVRTPFLTALAKRDWRWQMYELSEYWDSWCVILPCDATSEKKDIVSQRDMALKYGAECIPSGFNSNLTVFFLALYFEPDKYLEYAKNGLYFNGDGRPTLTRAPYSTQEEYEIDPQ